MNRHRALRSIAAAAMLAGATLSLTSPAALAAGQTVFGTPTAKSTFLTSIDVSEPVTLPPGVTRVEVLLTTEGIGSIDVDEITPTPGPGATTLSYHLPTPSGSLIANTLVQLRFRVTIGSGAAATVETGPVASVRYADTRFDWRTRAGDVVRVHWAVGDAAFGERALSIGEAGVAKAEQLLGVTEVTPIDFFIYPDDESFRDVLGPGTRENVGGVAFTNIRTLVAQISPSQVNAAWVGNVVPHELTHMVFDTATDNPYHSPPHWLNEGLAVYLAQGYDSGHRGDVTDAIAKRSLIPLPALDGQFPTFGDRFGLAYSESVSAVDFMVRHYGKPALVQLVRSYAHGRTDDEAFSAALGVNVDGFEAAWLADLGTTEPVAAGPQPDPPGPLPPGWEGPGATPGSVAGQPGGQTPGSEPASSSSPAPPAAGQSLGDLLVTAVVTAVIVLVVIGLVALGLSRRRRSPPPAPPMPG